MADYKETDIRTAVTADVSQNTADQAGLAELFSAAKNPARMPEDIDNQLVASLDPAQQQSAAALIRSFNSVSQRLIQKEAEFISRERYPADKPLSLTEAYLQDQEHMDLEQKFAQLASEIIKLSPTLGQAIIDREFSASHAALQRKSAGIYETDTASTTPNPLKTKVG